MKTFTLTLFASSIVLLGACASAPAEPPKTVPPPTNVTLDELNTAIEGGVMIQNEKGEEVIKSTLPQRCPACHKTRD